MLKQNIKKVKVDMEVYNILLEESFIQNRTISDVINEILINKYENKL